jgi:hypothetical protein
VNGWDDCRVVSGRVGSPVVRRMAVLTLLFAACASDPPAAPVPIAATAEALDARTVAVTFTRRVASIDQGSLSIFTPFLSPEESLAIEGVEVSGEVLTIRTAQQRGGVLYAVRLGAISFEGVERADAPSQLNFEGFGVAPIELRLDANGLVVPAEITALVTIDPATSRYTADFQRVRLDDADGDRVYRASLFAQIDPDRIYAARAVSPDGGEAGALVSFTVTSTMTVVVEIPARLPQLPEFDPPVDTRPGDGFAPVRIVIDDRFARVVKNPQLKLSLDAMGRFDIRLERLETLEPVPDKPRVYETIVEVAVDPQRRLGGMSADTFPYVTFLVNDGEDVNERGGSFEMPEEKPQLLVIPIANPSLVPVTFRIDAGSAILEPDRSLRGVYPGEGVFLTGEFPNAEDALGRLAADAFTGGERSTLEMAERPDAPGVYEKTIFLPPNRPYGWKVVRCPTGQGCSELNRHVTSSGRAFPTVMKNLTTSNDDAGGSESVRLIDPKNLDRVVLEDGSTADYSSARVSLTGMEAPSTSVMFKQEAPDLVVTVATEPLITPIYVVGTWRDVNIPERPTDIIMQGGTIELGPYDYDDGKMGRAPIVRDLMLPVDPGEAALPPGQPPYRGTDGDRDLRTRELSAGTDRLPLWVSWNEHELYVATQLAPAGRDHFIVLSLDAPDGAPPTQWNKSGTSAAGTRTFFLAMEGDGDFAAWFRRGTTGTDDTRVDTGVTVGRGQVLEGTIDLSALMFSGESIWIASVAYGTADRGALDVARQNPMGNADPNLDRAELREIRLRDIRAR